MRCASHAYASWPTAWTDRSRALVCTAWHGHTSTTGVGNLWRSVEPRVLHVPTSAVCSSSLNVTTLRPDNKKIMPPKKQVVSKKPAVAPPQPSLSWPQLAPLVPSSDLEIAEVLSDQILTISRFFTSSLCKTFVNFLQTSVALTTTPGVPKRGYAARVNDRFQIQDPGFAELLWTKSGLKQVVAREDHALWGGEVVGLNPK